MDWSRLSESKNPWGTHSRGNKSSNSHKTDDTVTDSINGNNLFPEIERLDNEERALSMKLKSFCTSSGEENAKTLKNSGEVLLDLGKVYLRRAILQESMEKKMSYIRCAVLIHAAIERFKIANDSEKMRAAKEVCQEMEKSVLESCDACSQIQLCAMSEKYVEKICHKRAEIERILNVELNRDGENDPAFSPKRLVLEKLKTLESMESISSADLESILSPGGAEKEIWITEKVRMVNDDVTNFFKKMMYDITEECINFLRPPPCKFSIVGLGSLAREEVTLYSDFEHIILLEEGIDEQEDYESVLEYFRWFSVVFQIVVIGFGETIIPSVAIRSLNDFYYEDAGLNWFYDNYTQKGISFDGMLPHACKIPLGRQQKTKYRSHVVELIKTPQKMANYLTQDEQIKNGYHLADVLRETCLVYGDHEIYASFMKERNRILEKDETKITKIYSDMILENTVPFVRHMNFTFTVGRIFNSKPAFYRPMATYLGVIARICNIDEKSTFGIIDELYQREILKSYAYNKLKYAFAIACEIRMKMYQKESHQNHATQFIDVETMMGQETIQICQRIMTYLRNATKNLVTKGDVAAMADGEMTFTGPGGSHAVTYLRHRGYCDAAIRLGEKLFEHAEHTDAKLMYSLLKSYYAAGIADRRQLLEYFQKAEALYSKIPEDEAWMDVEFTMASIYHFLGKLPERIAAYEKFFPKYFKYTQENYDHAYFTHACYGYYKSLLRSGMSFDVIDERLKIVLWDKTKNIECDLLKRMHVAGRSLGKGNTGVDIKKEFASISTDIQKNIKHLIQPRYLHFWIINLQIRNWWLKDVVETLRSAGVHHRTRSAQDELHVYDIQIFELLKLACLCRLYGSRAARHLARSKKEQEESLLRSLVAILWTGIHLSSRKIELITALSWIIHFKSQGWLHEVFLVHREMEDPENKHGIVKEIIKQYADVYCKNTFLDGALTSFAMLLIAKSL